MKTAPRNRTAGLVPGRDVSTSVRAPMIPRLALSRERACGIESPKRHGLGGIHSPAVTDGDCRSLQIVILGLSITSSWGNGHATTYRGLVRELVARGHRVLFLERDADGDAADDDLPEPQYCRVALYSSLKQLRDRFSSEVKNADLVMVGTYLEEGIAVGEWVTRIAQGVTSFYDIDTPITLAKLGGDGLSYLSRSLIPKYDIYFSFTGGPTLELIQKRYGSPKARALYRSVDPELYFPESLSSKWDLGYMGTYSDDRQPALDELLLRPAREWSGGRFVVAGPQYPRSIRWPRNVRRHTHLAPANHRAFYNSQRFTLNISRANMMEAGYSPNVRLFEAAACGTPIISDYWEGLDSFLRPGREILIARSSEECLRYLLEIPEPERRAVGARARALVLANHTASHRALELEKCVRSDSAA
jgi:spore maturation protein CgeB